MIQLRYLSGVISNWTNLLESEMARFTPSIYFSLSVMTTVLPLSVFFSYRKYPNLVHTKFLTLIIQCASCLKDNFQDTKFSPHFLLFRKFRRRKSTQIALEFIFFVSQKIVVYKILSTLNNFGLLLILLYSSTRGFSFSFMTSVIFLFVLLIV